jgi:hypothetical protein
VRGSAGRWPVVGAARKRGLGSGDDVDSGTGSRAPATKVGQ